MLQVHEILAVLQEFIYTEGMNELFFLVEEDPEGGFCAKALGEAIFTQGDSLEELKINIRDAVGCHFGEDKPQLIRLH
jgi:predicted RNase H-like HicB family nuclease